MILYQWRGQVPNFGDELNALLWPTLLPDFFDDDPSTRFLGIGSVLDSRHDGSAAKLVAGAGYGGYETATRLDPSWTIHWVRGPRTARLLGLDAQAGLGDPASLLPAIGVTGSPDGDLIGFMPHFESMDRGHWRQATAAAGLTLIDPRADPREVLGMIGRCRVLVSEALHGVIAADALRVPWIAVRPLAPAHRPKWLDWADSLNLRIKFRALQPSSALEYATRLPLSDRRPARLLLARHGARLHDVGRDRFIERASAALRRIAAESPQLSAAAALDRGVTRMFERIEQLRRDPFRGLGDARRSPPRASLLRVGDEFAYHPASIG